MNLHSESSHDNYDLSQHNQPQPSSSSSSSLSSASSPSSKTLDSVHNDQFKQINSKQHAQLPENDCYIQPSTSHDDAFSPHLGSNGTGRNDENNQPILDDAQVSLHPRDFHQLAQDKEAVYKHPLFPLLAILLEKCEYATATLGRQTGPPIATSKSTENSDDDSSISPPPSPPDEGNQSKSSCIQSTQESFNQQVQSLLDLHHKQGKPLLVDDDEVDTLMIKAIQVLRINLVELEKVQELCKDFCQRYITCLREKMSSENLLRGTAAFGSSGHAAFSFDASSRSSSPSSDEDSVPPAHPHHSANYRRMSGVRNAFESYNCGKRNMSPDDSAGPQVDAMNQHHLISFDVNDVQRDSGNEGDLSDDAATNAYLGSNGKNRQSSANNSSPSCKQKSSSKRGILPKQATSIMRSWLFQHIVHPYPTEDEKRAISAQTNLTLLQVNNWFINARRRILQPMLDSANTVSNSENNCNNSSNSNANPSSNGTIATSTANNNNNNLSNNNNGKLSVDLSSPPTGEVMNKRNKSTSHLKQAGNSSGLVWPVDATISPRSSLSGQ